MAGRKETQTLGPDLHPDLLKVGKVREVRKVRTPTSGSWAPERTVDRNRWASSVRTPSFLVAPRSPPLPLSSSPFHPPPFSPVSLSSSFSFLLLSQGLWEETAVLQGEMDRVRRSEAGQSQTAVCAALKCPSLPLPRWLCFIHQLKSFLKDSPHPYTVLQEP